MNKTVSTLASLVFVAVFVGIALTATGKPPSGLPDLGRIGRFSLIERSERPLTEKDFAGSVVIADFIFTRCAGPCSVMTTQMSILQNTLPKDVRYVTFSVDPERDTPAVLRRYAESYGAEPGRWLFATGTWPEIYAVTSKNFHLTAEKDPKNVPGFEIIHDLRFVLVDRAGRIRGYYIAASMSNYQPEEPELARLRADVEKLRKSGE